MSEGENVEERINTLNRRIFLWAETKCNGKFFGGVVKYYKR